MARKYLFSPIGNTDPIKYLYDGSMIHICRYYQPDVVYLYLSKEMMENHKKDNRYLGCPVNSYRLSAVYLLLFTRTSNDYFTTSLTLAALPTRSLK